MPSALPQRVLAAAPSCRSRRRRARRARRCAIRGPRRAGGRSAAHSLSRPSSTVRLYDGLGGGTSDLLDATRVPQSPPSQHDCCPHPRTTLEDPPRPRPEPRHHRARQHDPQRRPPVAAGALRRLELDAAVDGRLLPRLLRRPAAHDGHARRPLRPQARAADRHRPVRPLEPRRPVRRDVHAAHRRPRPDGRRRSADHARDAVDHHERLPARGARQGDRRVGRHGRDRRRPRPAVRRPAARVLRLVLGLPHQRARGARRLRGRHPLRARFARPQPGPLRRPRRAAVDRRPRGAHLRGHRGSRARLGGPGHPRRVRRRAGAGRRVRGLGAAHAPRRCST